MSNIIAVKDRTKDDYRKLVTFLKDRDYKLSESLESLKDYNQIKAIMIDHDKKSAHIPSTMVMACYVTCKKKVLSVDEYCQ